MLNIIAGKILNANIEWMTHFYYYSRERGIIKKKYFS